MRKMTSVPLLIFLCLCMSVYVHAQTLNVKGKIVDNNGTPVGNASIQVKNKTAGTVSKEDGTFAIHVASDGTLIVSALGFAEQRVEVGGKESIDIVLTKATKVLDEVVVTALGISRQKKSLGYAIQEVKGEQLTQSNEQNVLNSLSGKVAGVQITGASGAVGSSSRIVLRGNSSLGGNNQPLFVIDGVPVSNFATNLGSGGAVDYGNAIAEIDPNNIASVSVLKGANAAALYGQQAGNGVVLITTKDGKGAGKRMALSYSGGFSFENPYILPKFQNQYGQGTYGEEYMWKQYQAGELSLSDIGANTSLDPKSYQDWAQGVGFSYLDGLGNGTNDGVDESWGPRLDAGLLIPQYSNPLDANGNRVATPWISHPNNIRDFFTTGFTMDNAVALSTSSDKGNTRLALSNQKQQGAISNTDQNRYTIQLNTTQNFTNRFKINTNVNYVRTENNNLVGQGYNGNNPMQSIMGWFGRQVDMKDLKANWQKEFNGGFPYNWNSNFHDNPFFNVYNNTHSRYKDRMYGNVNLTYQFSKWFNAMVRVGDDWSTEIRKEISVNKTNSTSISKSERTWGGGSFRQNQYNLNTLNADLIFSGSGNITKDISLNYTAGANYQSYKQVYSQLGADQLTVPNVFTISNAKGSPVTGMATSRWRSNSLFGQASFGYKSWLYLDLTARNDWSSTLPEGNWSYFYPSASLSWVFTNVLNINPSILSYGKLRTSVAGVGKGAPNPYSTYGTYGANASGYNGVTLYSISSTLPPLNLMPEKATSSEVGLELQFLNGRLGLDATYYEKVTKNQIMTVDVSGASGFVKSQINAGEIQNKGIELQLNLGLLRSQKGLNWDMNINWAKNNSKVTKLYEDPVTGQKIASYAITSIWSRTIDAIPGQAYGVIRGGTFVRDANGAIVVNDNGMPKYDATPKPVGNITPDWIGGVSNTFTYKNFRFSFLVDARMGGDIFSVTQWFGLQSGVLQPTVDGGVRENGVVAGQNVFTDEKFVTADGKTNTARVNARDFFQSLWDGSEKAIIDASYIKLRQIEFGYTLPAKVTNKLGWLKGAGISLFAHNVALLYTSKSNLAHIDPETGFGVGNDGLGAEQYQIPSNRSIGVKLNINL